MMALAVKDTENTHKWMIYTHASHSRTSKQKIIMINHLLDIFVVYNLQRLTHLLLWLTRSQLCLIVQCELADSC